MRIDLPFVLPFYILYLTTEPVSLILAFYYLALVMVNVVFKPDDWIRRRHWYLWGFFSLLPMYDANFAN
jgi:hypothetical protein